jgi:uroporphyrinogen decarboxylase
MNRFQKTIRRKNTGRPPVWFMRQAGRYHTHYQGLRSKHGFMDLCKIPEVACETTLGPIRDFDFDAAILFSDLLFPLEVLGMGLSYEPGPKLAWHLQQKSDLVRLDSSGAELAGRLQYQADAMAMIRRALSPEKGLIGFVGGPLTLFFYAASGSHSGDLKSAHDGMKDGRFEGFCERLEDLLAENMAMQARAGADTVAMLDTCAGEVSVEVYREKVVPATRRVLDKFVAKCPETPVTYYSKNTRRDYWKQLAGLPIGALGVDWKVDLPGVLEEFGGDYAIQGNIDPHWLFLPWEELRSNVSDIYNRMARVTPRKLDGWISGLGHGVLPKTPEENVRNLVRLNHDVFGRWDREAR